jgi:predicted CXXCH cytochrome family protein
MKKTLLASLSLAVVLATGCTDTTQTGPWLTMQDAATHAAKFPIAVGDTHDLNVVAPFGSCNGCHADTSKTPSVPSPTFKHFSCTNCHVLLKSGLWHDDSQALFSAWHVGAGVSQFDATVAAMPNVLGGVAPLDAACRSCHQSGIAVNHSVRFVLPHQNAAATIVARCADCHVVPANRKVLGCAQCHPHDLAPTTIAHAMVPGFVATDSMLCARCHEDGKIPVRVTAHAAGAKGFIVGAGVHSGLTGGACLTCHAQNKTTVPRTFVADFTVTTCVGCHVTVGGTAQHDNSDGTLTTLHASVPTFTSTVASLGLSAACLSCHADGGAGAPSNHELLFPRGAGTKHAGLGCVQCHGVGVKTDLTALACYTCHVTNAASATPPLNVATFNNSHAAPLNHTSTGKNTFTLLNMASGATCLRCHAPSTINPLNPIMPVTLATHSTGESSMNSAKHKNVGCVDCHNSTLTVQANYPAQDFTKRSCLTCHSSNNP